MRLVDWNRTLGTLLFSALLVGFSLFFALYPEPEETADWRDKVLPYVGPVVAFFMLKSLVIYVQIGERLVFQGAFGKRTYRWDEVRALRFEEDVDPFFYGLLKFRHEYLKFVVVQRGKEETYSYRVTGRRRDAVLEALAAHAPWWKQDEE